MFSIPPVECVLYTACRMSSGLTSPPVTMSFVRRVILDDLEFVTYPDPRVDPYI